MQITRQGLSAASRDQLGSRARAATTLAQPGVCRD